MACMLCARCRQQNKVPLAKKMTLLAEGSLHSASHKNTAVRRNQTLPLAGRAVSPTDRRRSNQRCAQRRPILTAG